MAQLTNSLLPTMSRFFDDFLTRDLADWNNGNFSITNTTLPAVNIVETGDSFLIELAAPGLSKEDFIVEFKDNLLTIRSERRKEEKSREGERFVRREFSYQSFQRAFQFGRNVIDGDKINATYIDGMLRLTLPKREEVKAKEPRRIEII